MLQAMIHVPVSPSKPRPISPSTDNFPFLSKYALLTSVILVLHRSDGLIPF